MNKFNCFVAAQVYLLFMNNMYIYNNVIFELWFLSMISVLQEYNSYILLYGSYQCLSFFLFFN